MLKKYICIGIMMIMIFSLAACNQSDDSINLEAYKTDANTSLDTYFRAKGEANYTTEAWQIIEEIVAESKSKLSSATDSVDIDSVVTAAKQLIDAVLPKGCDDMENKYLDTSLFNYEIAAKKELEDYAQDKGKDYYTPEQWKIIYGFVEEGKKDLFEVKDKADVDSVVMATKQRIDTVISKGIDDGIYKDLEPGFYSLQDAYDLGAIKKSDLMSIAYYRAGRFGNENIIDENFAAIPKNPEVLDAETVEQIKKDYIDWLITTGVALQPPTHGAQIDMYYGTYNDCVVVMMGYVNGAYLTMCGYEFIGGVKFGYSNSQRIQVWKKSK